MHDNFSKSRLFKNSILLYIRMLFTMWINLYTTRLVLKNLGVEDLGTYGVVGSIVGLFSIVTCGFTNTIQRFITFEQGKEDGNVNKVFCTSINIIIMVSVLLFFILESIGVWFMNYKIEIPYSKMDAALWVYQLSVFTCIIHLLSIPYNSLVIANERMDFYAFISIIQVGLHCVSAYCLSFFPADRLIVYAIMMASISVLFRLGYQVYCNVRFPSSKYHWFIDFALLKEMGRFTGVTTVNGVLQTGYGQLMVMIINWTFGVTINAVYTIALQLKNMVLSFAFNIFKAISPQITKTYASGHIESHIQLVMIGSKAQVYMIYLIMIPFLFRTEFLLNLWLGEVPIYLMEYCQCSIFLSLLYAIFEPIRTSVMATNKIKKFMIIPDIVFVLFLPICYVIGRYTNNPILLMISFVLAEFIINGIRLFYALQVCPFSYREIVVETFIPLLFVFIMDVFFCYLFQSYISMNLVGLILVIIINALLLVFLIYLIGINKKERHFINSIVVKQLISIKKRA